MKSGDNLVKRRSQQETMKELAVQAALLAAARSDNIRLGKFWSCDRFPKQQEFTLFIYDFFETHKYVQCIYVLIDWYVSSILALLACNVCRKETQKLEYTEDSHDRRKETAMSMLLAAKKDTPHREG